MNHDFFSHFWFSYVLSYDEFVEVINMHAMKPRVQVLWAAPGSGARGALPLVGGSHNNVGVSLREMRATTQVNGKMGLNSSVLQHV